MLVNVCLVSIQLQFKQAVLNASGIQEGMDYSVGRHKALLRAEQILVLAASHTAILCSNFIKKETHNNSTYKLRNK